VARAKRNKSYRLAKLHDRRSRDLPLNAEVAAVEVDDPLALEPGEKIVALRSIRNDPLGRLHSHRQIDEAQYQGGRSRTIGRRPSVARRRSIRRANLSTASDHRGPAQGRAAAFLRGARAWRRWRGAGARGAGHGAVDGAGRPAAQLAEPALERLFLAAVSRMPRPAGPDLRFCERQFGRKRPAALTFYRFAVR